MNTSRPGHSLRQTLVLIFWLVIVLLQIVVILRGLPELFAALQQPCSDTITVCQARMQLTPGQAELWSMDAYAWYGVITRLLARIVSFLLGLLIFVKRPTSRIAWITSLYLIIGIETGISDSLAIAQPVWLPVTLVLQFVGEICLILFFLLFPNDRFAPRWTRWFPLVYAPLTAAGSILWLLLIGGNLDLETTARLENLRVAQGVLFLGMILTLVGIIIYRYRTLFAFAERQKTKWVIYAFALGYGLFVAVILLSLALGWVDAPLPPGLYILQDLLATGLISFLIPAAITIAILRYQLFDIDHLIRRTLQYTLLTALLALVYFGSVVLMQSLFEYLTGQGSPIVIVISTLAIAALFNPLRQRVQRFIDLRFYRRKYQADQVLKQFAATIRDEVDMDELTVSLLGVVAETVQPEKVSLWLQPVANNRTMAIGTGFRSNRDD